MNKISCRLLALILIALALTGCGAGNNTRSEVSASGKISVVTTIFPAYDFARQIAGDRADIAMLLTPGAESHTYEPSPEDIIKIQSSDIFIYTGGESDQWLRDILDSLDTSSMEIIAMMDCVEVVEEVLAEGMEADDAETGEAVDSEEEGIEEPEYDEHVWTSPMNAIAIAGEIEASLCRVDNENSTYYGKRMSEYKKELTALDEEFREVVQSSTLNTVIFGDRFPFRYLADLYGLRYYAAFPGCSSETEASAATVAFLIDKVKEEDISVVFHIELSNEKLTDAICEATGAKKLQLHTCHNVTRADFDAGVTYVGLMAQNIRNLSEALNGA